MAPGLGARMRHLLGHLHDAFDVSAHLYPDIRAALESLDGAVLASFPSLPRRRPLTKPVLPRDAKIRRLQKALAYARLSKSKIQDELLAFRAGKQTQSQNRMSPEFVAKVALSVPSASARGFEAAWQELVGTDAAGCSRGTSTRIRDAFVEVVKGIAVQRVQALASQVFFRRHRQHQCLSRLWPVHRQLWRRAWTPLLLFPRALCRLQFPLWPCCTFMTRRACGYAPPQI